MIIICLQYRPQATTSYCHKVNLTNCHPNIAFHDSNTLAYFSYEKFYDTVLRKEKKCVPGKKNFWLEKVFPLSESEARAEDLIVTGITSWARTHVLKNKWGLYYKKFHPSPIFVGKAELEWSQFLGSRLHSQKLWGIYNTIFTQIQYLWAIPIVYPWRVEYLYVLALMFSKTIRACTIKFSPQSNICG